MLSNRYKILLIPFITVLIMSGSILLMIFQDYRTFEELKPFATGKFGYAFGNSVVTVLIFYFVINFFNRIFEWSRNWVIRFIMDLALIGGYSALVMAILTFLSNHGMIPPVPMEDHKEFLFVIPLMMNSLYLVIIEMVLSAEERNKLAVKVAQMEKEQINAKYGALKEQLDHHFLFNNLSVLSSLIYEDVEKADRFIQDFSSTYRYVLQINQRNLVTLKEELGFIENYLNLYKSRFEEGFEYILKVDPTHLNRKIPPLTLQVLVENAIKHNQVSRENPLMVEIIATNNQLVVQNTLQLKTEQPDSTQKGQINLVEKYRLLGDQLPEFKSENDKYIVSIPLIEDDEN